MRILLTLVAAMFWSGSVMPEGTNSISIDHAELGSFVTAYSQQDRRERNKIAAKKHRDKKKVKLQGLESRLKSLETENAVLTSTNETLRRFIRQLQPATQEPSAFLDDNSDSIRVCKRPRRDVSPTVHQTPTKADTVCIHTATPCSQPPDAQCDEMYAAADALSATVKSSVKGVPTVTPTDMPPNIHGSPRIMCSSPEFSLHMPKASLSDHSMNPWVEEEVMLCGSQLDSDYSPKSNPSTSSSELPSCEAEKFVPPVPYDQHGSDNDSTFNEMEIDESLLLETFIL